MTVALKSPRVPDHVVDAQFTGRWSPRAFTAETMSEEALLTLLEAARWAPSAVNVQPWRFAWGLRGDAGFAAIAGALVPFNGWAKEWQWPRRPREWPRTAAKWPTPPMRSTPGRLGSALRFRPIWRAGRRMA